MKKEKRYTLREVVEVLEVQSTVITQCIQKEWISPVDPESSEFDQEDLARLQLINELREKVGVNDEAIPIIMHLIDQIHCLHQEIRKKGQDI
ncbi:MAG: hypothetical protein HQM13_13480 [SAR324 cluster bacterium]|nr:hypothetical protein [SAR324 cluster bacterium]